MKRVLEKRYTVCCFFPRSRPDNVYEIEKAQHLIDELKRRIGDAIRIRYLRETGTHDFVLAEALEWSNNHAQQQKPVLVEEVLKDEI